MVRKELYERAIQYGLDWRYGDDADEVFHCLFSSEAELIDSKEIADKFYAVLDAIQDQLLEEGFLKSALELVPLVAPCPEDRSDALLIFNETKKIVYWIRDKHWHLWDSPTQMMKDLEEIYNVVKSAIEKERNILNLLSSSAMDKERKNESEAKSSARRNPDLEP